MKIPTIHCRSLIASPIKNCKSKRNLQSTLPAIIAIHSSRMYLQTIKTQLTITDNTVNPKAGVHIIIRKNFLIPIQSSIHTTITGKSIFNYEFISIIIVTILTDQTYHSGVAFLIPWEMISLLELKIIMKRSHSKPN